VSVAIHGHFPFHSSSLKADLHYNLRINKSLISA
jgi:hypothetical protein